MYVDKIPYYQMISYGCRVLELDLMTATVEDLQFNAPFRLTVGRGFYESYLSGIVAWFEVEFPSDPKDNCEHIILSTSPFSEMTHWE